MRQRLKSPCSHLFPRDAVAFSGRDGNSLRLKPDPPLAPVGDPDLHFGSKRYEGAGKHQTGNKQRQFFNENSIVTAAF
jgi:hypothetical protein